jgi:hypothetical protein
VKRGDERKKRGEKRRGEGWEGGEKRRKGKKRELHTVRVNIIVYYIYLCFIPVYLCILGHKVKCIFTVGHRTK